VLSSAERSDTERLTAVVALANFAPTRAELLAAPVAGRVEIIQGVLTKLHSSVKSKSMWLFFGRVVFSRRALEARPKDSHVEVVLTI